ncbi:uncharacterized protein [Miscanthus floridulus]|uniref:uncharacterized protein n=1 Tax=Miscanthus floridulus TaxID=154761 RepID=UPI003457912A
MEEGAGAGAGTWNARRRRRGQAVEEDMCLGRAFVEEILMEEEQGTRGTTFLISRLRGPAPCEVARGRHRARPRGATTSSEHGCPFEVKVFDLLTSRVLLRHMPVKGGS